MKLYEFQRVGVKYLLDNPKSMLCDLMGLGKTAQAVVAGDLLLKNSKIDKILIFCPNAIKEQWKTEIKRWTNRDADIVNSTTPMWQTNTNTLKDITIINYEKMVSVKFYDEVRYVCTNFRCAIILDEAQYIKGRYSKRGMRIRTLKAPVKWILTGTPIMNKPEEFYNINSFLNNDILGPYYKFRDRYIVKGKFNEILGYKHLDELKTKIESVMLRRTRDEVDIDFPKKVYETYAVKLSSKERKVYDEVTQLLTGEMDRYIKGNSIATNILAAYVLYKQVCDDVSLLNTSNSDAAALIKSKHNVNVMSSKVKELKRIVESIDGKVVIFTQFKRMAYKLQEVFMKDYDPAVLTGDTAHLTSDLIDKFANNKGCKIFIMTTAGKYGLDGLQIADYIILYDMLWNPKEMEQIEDRIVRIGTEGQHKTIIRLMVSDEDSIEQRVLNVLRNKENMIDKIV